ncbi:NlpC/P60 family protein [Jiangella gansuensis]|uniref:C40 family peptidase n=1 Tax=Jiangella gansuensis TaxID=281473 RepID=UPI00047B86C0|nr:NlpC/P60 family protein [Jiangella gansuensis]
MRTGIVVGLVAAAAAAGVVGPAYADPTYPSESDIEEARDAEEAAAGTVAGLEARLAQLAATVDGLYIQAAKAVEAYNGARVLLAEAQQAEQAATEAAGRLAAEAEQARADLGRMAAKSYSNGGQLATVGMVLGAEDGEALYDRVGVLRAVTRSQATISQRAKDATAAAEQAAAAAAEARAERENAARDAEAARDAAEAAVAGQEQALAAVEAERSTALAQLAAARGTTVDLERQRQEGLAAEQEAQQPVEPLADDPTVTVEPTPEPTPTTEPTAEPTTEPSTEPSAEPTTEATTPPRPEPTIEPTAEPTSEPTVEPTPEPTETQPPDEPEEPEQPAGAQAAIDFALAQVGKPYEWGADGPNSFDCSGLTMRAWQAGGVNLPHWSVAQAQRVDRVSYSDLRPGDLIFWSDNGQASGVYHVGLYIGGGKMVHAPRPGKNVEVQNVFYWVDPAFYGRV